MPRPLEGSGARPDMKPVLCAGCGQAFECGAGTSACWCAGLPARLPVPRAPEDAGCYCRRCLEKLLARDADAPA